MGQLLRQGGRFFAIYISDLLLWLSLAGIFEILFVIVAGALCILTAGFIFEGMKRHPVVMVFGTALALAGTFLVFREVRGFIWPAPTAAEADVKPARKAPRPPAATGTPSSILPPKTSPSSTALERLRCASRKRDACSASSACYWSVISDRCLAKLESDLLGDPPPTAAGNTSFCGTFSKLTCATQQPCYWSPLTGRCETLRVGRGLFSGSSTAPERCLGKTELMCLSTASCKWSSSLKLCSSAGQAP